MIPQRLKMMMTHPWARKFAVYGIGQAFNLVTPLLITPFIIARCGVEGLGRKEMGFAMALFLILIVDYAFEVKSMKRVSENRHTPGIIDETAGYTFFTKGILFLAASGLATILILTIPFFRSDPSLYFFSLSIVFAQVFNPGWLLQGLEYYGVVAALNVASKLCYVVLVLLLIHQAEDYRFINLLLGLSALGANLVALAWCRKQLQLSFPRPSTKTVVGILRHDFSFCVSQLALSVRQLSPLMLAGFFLGNKMAGYYKLIEQFVSLARTATQVCLRFFFPKTCFLYNQDATSGMSLWKKYTAMIAATAMAALTILFLFAEPVLHFFRLSGQEVTQLLPVFKTSLVIPALITLSLALEQVLFVKGKNRSYVKVTIFVTALNVALILLLIRRFELWGIVWSLLICEVSFISGYAISAFYSRAKIPQQ